MSFATSPESYDSICCFRSSAHGRIRVLWELNTHCNLACAFCHASPNTDHGTDLAAILAGYAVHRLFEAPAERWEQRHAAIAGKTSGTARLNTGPFDRDSMRAVVRSDRNLWRACSSASRLARSSSAIAR